MSRYLNTGMIRIYNVNQGEFTMKDLTKTRWAKTGITFLNIILSLAFFIIALFLLSQFWDETIAYSRYIDDISVVLVCFAVSLIFDKGHILGSVYGISWQAFAVIVLRLIALPYGDKNLKLPHSVYIEFLATSFVIIVIALVGNFIRKNIIFRKKANRPDCRGNI